MFIFGMNNACHLALFYKWYSTYVMLVYVVNAACYVGLSIAGQEKKNRNNIITPPK